MRSGLLTGTELTDLLETVEPSMGAESDADPPDPAAAEVPALMRAEHSSSELAAVPALSQLAGGPELTVAVADNPPPFSEAAELHLVTSGDAEDAVMLPLVEHHAGSFPHAADDAVTLSQPGDRAASGGSGAVSPPQEAVLDLPESMDTAIL